MGDPPSQTAVAKAGRRDPRGGSSLARLFRGGGYLLEGSRLVFGDAELRRLAILPMIISLAVFVGVAAALFAYSGDITQWIWPKPSSWLLMALWRLFGLFVVAGLFIAGVMVFFVLQGLLTSQFNDVLSERIEQRVFGLDPRPSSAGGVAVGLLRGLAHEVLKLGMWLSVMGPLFALAVIVPVIGPMALALVGLLFNVRFVAYDLFDLCMGRRGWVWSRKRQFLRDHRALGFGFGGAAAGVMLVPIVGALSVPIAAAGATLLFNDLEGAR